MFRLRPLLSLSRGITTSSILRRKPGFNIANLCLRFTHSYPGSTLPNLPLFAALRDHNSSRTAIVHSASSRSFTYGNLVADVLRAKQDLLAKAGDKGVVGERIPFLIENSYDYVVTLLAILAADAIAVPLSPAFPAGELRYILQNCGAGVLLSSEKYAQKAREVVSGLDNPVALHVTPKITTGSEPVQGVSLRDLEGHGGIMLYTSGTTNRPKGVLIPQSALNAQAAALVKAWEYSPDDRLLHLLPLHHIHGTVNGIITPVLAGSVIEFMFPFNPDSVWRRLAAPFQPANSSENAKEITFLTAVPTIYNKLLSTFPNLPQETQHPARQSISPTHLRLNISGSAALPTPTKQAWQDLSNGNVLLERYGMTEVGMAISCGLHFDDRVDASVGWPLPSVEARLVDTDTNTVIEPGHEVDDATGREREGEIQLRGPCVFKEYWGNEKATNEAFVEDSNGGGKWFKTGDVATRRVVSTAGKGKSGEWAQGPMYFIQGRQSVDIIKTGGEKVSALEVERELLSLYVPAPVSTLYPLDLHTDKMVASPQITEAAVLALPSEQWGQKVAAVITLHPAAVASGKNGKPWGAMDMRRALKNRLAAFKIPVEVRVVEAVPRNAMGKGEFSFLPLYLIELGEVKLK